MAPLALSANLATRWCHLHKLQIWPTGAIWFTNKMSTIALVANLANRWHNLHWFKIWTWGGSTCIGFKVDHQVASLHCHIALNCPIGIISQYWVGIFISQSHISRVSQTSLTDWRTYGPKDRTPGYLGPIKKWATINNHSLLWKIMWYSTQFFCQNLCSVYIFRQFSWVEKQFPLFFILGYLG